MAAKRKYRVLAESISYGDRNVEVGSVVDDIPAESVPWLLEQGVIEPAAKKKEG